MFSKEELIEFYEAEQKVRIQFQKHNEELKALHQELLQKSFFIEEQYITIKNKLFGKSSERSTKGSSPSGAGNKNKGKKVQLPSVRYPNLPLIERDITLDKPPSCSCCGNHMSDSGMTEDSEYLTVVPAQYYVVRQRRHKYRCEKCHGDIKTAPAPQGLKRGQAIAMR